jgi:hypothetical protein
MMMAAMDVRGHRFEVTAGQELSQRILALFANGFFDAGDSNFNE